MVGEVETVLKAENLMAVTNLAQEERQNIPQSNKGTTLDLDFKGHPTIKTKNNDFVCPNAGRRALFQEWFRGFWRDAGYAQNEFRQQPILTTASFEHMKEYAEYLCGR